MQLYCIRLPRWLSVKESTCQEGDVGLIPGLGRFPGEGNINPFQYLCLGNPMDRRTEGYSPCVARHDSDLTHTHTHTHTVCNSRHVQGDKVILLLTSDVGRTQIRTRLLIRFIINKCFAKGTDTVQVGWMLAICISESHQYPSPGNFCYCS